MKQLRVLDVLPQAAVLEQCLSECLRVQQGAPAGHEFSVTPSLAHMEHARIPRPAKLCKYLIVAFSASGCNSAAKTSWL